ncbi:SRPBCC family protein [Mucilaginibacter sp. HD30]
MANYETVVEKDLPNKTLHVVREFKGTVERVWAAWTQAELLDQWWAPRPWKPLAKAWTSNPVAYGCIIC